MSFGQNFQERNASFEHMYSATRAKKLFKRHRDINERFERNMARMEWETKTKLNELQNGKSMVERRGEVLYKKVRDIEDRELNQLTSAYSRGLEDNEEEEEEEEEYIEKPRPRQRSGKKTVNIRPLTTQATSEEHKRSRSDLGSREGSRPSSSNKPRPHTSVHFALPMDEDDEKENKSVIMEGPPYLARKSSVLDRRARRKSVFARTKAKQYELRNEQFKEENYELQMELNEKIQDYYVRLDKYKEDYRKSMEPKSKELPDILDKDITSKDDISGEKYSSQYFQKKLLNPFANKAKYMDLDKGNDDMLQSKSHESIKSILSSKPNHDQPVVKEEPVNQLGKSKEAETSKTSLVSRTSSTHSERPSSLTRQTVRRTLSISSRPSIENDNEEDGTAEQPSSQNMMKDRLKLLYLDAHGELKCEEKEPAKPNPLSKIIKRKSELHPDASIIEEAFDEFIIGGKSHEDMMRLVSVAAKLKHNARKKRDKSFIPFIAVRKAVNTWKSLVSRSKTNITAEEMS